ncbi:MAG: glycosyltransferase family 39 protein [Bacteroidetes bacterium]|nr:glycosyltransferase family 39 protein [Bacteroidota bacterium]
MSKKKHRNPEIKPAAAQAKPKNKEIRKPLKERFKDFFTQKRTFFFTEPLAALKQDEFKKTWANGQHPFYRFIFAILVISSFIFIPYLSFDFGITWDEFEDIGYFNEVLAYFTSFGEDKRCLDVEGTMQGHEVKTALIPHLVNYGPFVNLSSAFAYKFLSPFGLYETRHLVVSLFTCIGLMFTGLLAKRAGNWQTAVLAFLFILLTPTIFGHGMNNQKDIPFMAFYVVSLYYIIKFIEEMPDPTRGTWIKLGISMGILMSIRVGGLIVFAYLLLFSAILFLINVYKKNHSFNSSNIWLYIKKLFKPIALGYGVGVIFWPAALQAPFKHPFEALKNFEKFSLVHIYEIFEGKKYYMKDFPWYYEPKSMLITIPLFVLAGYALALILSSIDFKKIKLWHVLILLFATAFPVFYIIYKKSAVYSSWRHLLFVYPTIVVMAAIGWQRLIHKIKSGYLKWVTVIIIIALAGKTGAWMIKNHPYQYLYYNEIVGGVKGAYGNYETDYWCQSPRAAIEWLLENENLKNTKKRIFVASNNESHSMSYYAEKQTDSITIVWTRDFEWDEKYWDYAIFTTRTLSKVQLTNGYFPLKGTIHKITVDGVPIAIVVKRQNFDYYQAIKLKHENKLDTALILFKKATKYAPLNEGPYREMGYIKFIQNKFDEAVPLLKKSIELCPENYYSFTYLGYLYQQKKNTDSAEYYFKKAIEYKQNMSSAWDGLGTISLEKNDAYTAKKQLLRAAEYGGNNYFLYYNIGRVYEILSYPDSALIYYDYSTKLNPNFPYPYKSIGEILKRQGNPQADEFLNRARQMGLQ